MTGSPALSRRTILRAFALSAGAAAAAPLLALETAVAESVSSGEDAVRGTVTALTRSKGKVLGANRRVDGTYELVHLGSGSTTEAEPMNGVPSSAEITGLCTGADGVLYASGSTAANVVLAHVNSDAGGMAELRGLRSASGLWQRLDTNTWEEVYRGPRERLSSIASWNGSVMAVGDLLDEQGVLSGQVSVKGSGRDWRRQELDLASAPGDEASLVAVAAWRGSWVAAATGVRRSQLWTSRDGARWQMKPISALAAGIGVQALDGSSAELLIAGNEIATAQPALLAVRADGGARSMPVPRSRASAAHEVVLAMVGGDGRSIAYAAGSATSRITHF